MNSRAVTAVASILLLFMLIQPSGAQTAAGTENYKCPVCGMFVSKYPDFSAEIRFRDGSLVRFDGAKDLFKYYFNISAYDPKRSKADIAAFFVTDYYSLKLIDGAKAFYVIGSNVYGPMGKELIPFEKKAAAEIFKRDHRGTKILSYRELTLQTVTALDSGAP